MTKKELSNIDFPQLKQVFQNETNRIRFCFVPCWRVSGDHRSSKELVPLLKYANEFDIMVKHHECLGPIFAIGILYSRITVQGEPFSANLPSVCSTRCGHLPPGPKMIGDLVPQSVRN